MTECKPIGTYGEQPVLLLFVISVTVVWIEVNVIGLLIFLYYKYMLHFKKYTQNVGLLKTIYRGLFPPIFVIVHASIRPSVPLHLQVTCGTSLWEFSSFICHLSGIEQQADSKHSCNSAGIVTLASADMSAHTYCVA